MAKKFGKFLLFTAAVGTAAAAVHYYLQKKGVGHAESEDEDYDDFSGDSPNYVSLTPDAKDEAAGAADAKGEAAGAAEEQDAPAKDGFTPLKESVENAAEKADDTIENVEEFFDEEDASDEEPAISDN
ncbi:MAG: hypothetical protein NC123_09130 [Butyrivibrio sp.]|nr:hypothetical protein [Acetatifactor muris]MCM1559696.1 hypothetical protein [Butyrivibrio sp.]